MKFAAGTRDSTTKRPYFYKSECGEYTVTIPNDETTGLYGAWGHEKDECGKRIALSLGYRHATAALAKAACEAHAGSQALGRAA